MNKKQKFMYALLIIGIIMYAIAIHFVKQFSHIVAFVGLGYAIISLYIIIKEHITKQDERYKQLKEKVDMMENMWEF